MFESILEFLRFQGDSITQNVVIITKKVGSAHPSYPTSLGGIDRRIGLRHCKDTNFIFNAKGTCHKITSAPADFASGVADWHREINLRPRICVGEAKIIKAEKIWATANANSRR